MNKANPYRERIAELKEGLNAIIVAHNYQRPEIQDIADFTGDSLELSRKCMDIDTDTIVFCGVRFMAETAAILNPASTVLLTEPTAGCPMAEMVTQDELQQLKREHPGAPVVCYVNSTAEIKAESDICCTSANGVDVVNSLSASDIIFIPDQNLGHYISTKSTKNIILHSGYCYVHHHLKPEEIIAAKQEHPEALVIVHPECRPEVIDLADAACSTSQMIRYVKESNNNSFIIGTEEGILHRLRNDNPEKTFYLVTGNQVCLDMKKTTFDTLIRTMERKENVITIPEDIRVRAHQAIERMLAVK